MGVYLWTIFMTLLASIPLIISAWAFLDAARRPEWVWALAGRQQIWWLIAIGFSTVTVIGGPLVALWYLFRVRPVLADAEEGRLAD